MEDMTTWAEEYSKGLYLDGTKIKIDLFVTPYWENENYKKLKNYTFTNK